MNPIFATALWLAPVLLLLAMACALLRLRPGERGVPRQCMVR